MTPAQLRALLALAHGPAVERLTTIVDPAFGVTPRAIAWHYLTRNITLHGHMLGWFLPDLMEDLDGRGDRLLDLTDPGTVNAVRAALALARGFDPSNGVKWTRNGADNAWILDASDWCAFATSTAARSVTPSRRVIEADPVGNETDSTRALTLAVEHVLKAAK